MGPTGQGDPFGGRDQKGRGDERQAAPGREAGGHAEPDAEPGRQTARPLGGPHRLGAVILGTETEHSDKHYRYSVAAGK